MIKGSPRLCRIRASSSTSFGSVQKISDFLLRGREYCRCRRAASENYVITIGLGDDPQAGNVPRAKMLHAS